MDTWDKAGCLLGDEHWRRQGAFPLNLDALRARATLLEHLPQAEETCSAMT